MKTKIVRFDLNAIPPLTEAQRQNLRALAARADNEIDTSDAPEMTDEQWENAERGRFYRPVERQITARVDTGFPVRTSLEVCGFPACPPNSLTLEA